MNNTEEKIITLENEIYRLKKELKIKEQTITKLSNRIIDLEEQINTTTEDKVRVSFKKHLLTKNKL